jgi:hypothetical protein
MTPRNWIIHLPNYTEENKVNKIIMVEIGSSLPVYLMAGLYYHSAA